MARKDSDPEKSADSANFKQGRHAMQAECPTCGRKYDIPDDRIPPDGTTAKCRSCGGRFLLLPPCPAPRRDSPSCPVEPDPAAETMTCPKCGDAQPESPICQFCGIVFAKWGQPKPPPEPDPEPDGPEERGPITTGEAIIGCLIDFQFTEFVTPLLIRLWYAVLVMLGGLAAGWMIFRNLFAGEVAIAGGVAAAYIIILFSARVAAEIIFVAFRIEQNTRDAHHGHPTKPQQKKSNGI